MPHRHGKSIVVATLIVVALLVAHCGSGAEPGTADAGGSSGRDGNAITGDAGEGDGGMDATTGGDEIGPDVAVYDIGIPDSGAVDDDASLDGGPGEDAEIDGGQIVDGGEDGSLDQDSGLDVGQVNDGALPDAGEDTGSEEDADVDGGVDSGQDAGSDGGFDAGRDGGQDSGDMDTGQDASSDVGADAGFDAGCAPTCAGKECGDDGCGGLCPDGCTPPQVCGGGGTLNVCGVITVNCGPSPNGRGGDMCEVPAGPYMMGCNEAVDTECTTAERPYHLIAVPAFFIDKYLVTAGAYRTCVLEGGCPAAYTGVQCNYGAPGRENHPINCVSYDFGGVADYQIAYCNWVGKRLASEAEWEKAARGMDGRKYPWGNDPLDCEHAISSVVPCSNTTTAPVGSKPLGASPYGVLDMVGNVWEYAEDGWHENYEGAPSDGSVWPRIPGMLSVTVRGGSWHGTDSGHFRASARSSDGWDPSYVGFRCALSPDAVCIPDCVGKCGGDNKCGGTCPNNCVAPQVCGEGGTPDVCATVTQHCVPSPTGLGGEMCDIPAGPFMMGQNSLVDRAWHYDTPYHQVTIPAFKMDKYPVTTAEYTACVAASACSAAVSSSWCNYGAAGKESHPITCVNWNQAKTYCAWTGKRLPSESEWEKAARGTDGRLYPWGNDSLDCVHAVWCENAVDYPNNCGCGSGGTMPVGSKPQGASPYGALDMVGNVFQWMEDDWHSDYDLDNDGYQPGGDGGNDGPSDGSAWVDDPRDRERVGRGAGWHANSSRYMRTSDRQWLDPTSSGTDPGLGFRCAWSQ